MSWLSMAVWSSASTYIRRVLVRPIADSEQTTLAASIAGPLSSATGTLPPALIQVAASQGMKRRNAVGLISSVDLRHWEVNRV